MRKYLFIVMILFTLLTVAAGCDNDKDKNMTSNTKSPLITTNPGISESPDVTGGTGNPAMTDKNTGNIEPTDSLLKEDIEDRLNDLMPTEYFSDKNKDMNVKNMSDNELRNIIIEEVRAKNYNIYSLSEVKRSMVDNKSTVDLESTLKSVRKNNDMASTRFVFKGGKVVDTAATGIFEKVAEYKTPLLSKSKEAKYNMDKANKILNGTVIRSGEEFSFRFFLGKTGEEEGYKEATVFIKDPDTHEVKEEDQVGGGLCQVSSTLHGACLELELKIKERHAHSKPVKYIEEGKDAAFSGDYYDLKFENTMEYPIAILFYMDDKYEVVEIYRLA